MQIRVVFTIVIQHCLRKIPKPHVHTVCAQIIAGNKGTETLQFFSYG